MVFDTDRAYRELSPHFQKRLHRHELLSHHSSFGVGGPADLWVTLETLQELKDVVSLCAERGWPLLIVGAGSNILYADAGVRGIVVRLGFHGYALEEQSDSSAMVIAESGVRWTY